MHRRRHISYHTLRHKKQIIDQDPFELVRNEVVYTVGIESRIAGGVRTLWFCICLILVFLFHTVKNAISAKIFQR